MIRHQRPELDELTTTNSTVLMTVCGDKPLSADRKSSRRPLGGLKSLELISYLLELLTTEEIREELLDLGDTGGTANKDDLIDLLLLDGSVLEDLLDGFKGTVEGGGVQVFETSTGDLNGEVLTIEERVNLDGGLGGVGEGTLSTLASSSEAAESTGITGQILLGLAGELLLAEIKQVGIEVLTTEMSVTGSSLHSKHTTLNVQKRDIKSTTTKVIDENVALLIRLARAETVSDSGGSRLVDDTEDVKASNGTSILGSLTLVVVEVGGDGNDGLGDGFAELGLSNLFHLWSRQHRVTWVLRYVHGPS